MKTIKCLKNKEINFKNYLCCKCGIHLQVHTVGCTCKGSIKQNAYNYLIHIKINKVHPIGCTAYGRMHLFNGDLRWVFVSEFHFGESFFIRFYGSLSARASFNIESVIKSIIHQPKHGTGYFFLKCCRNQDNSL